MKPRRSLLLGSLVVISLVSFSQAATLQWAGLGSGLTGGASDTWDTATANWSDGNPALLSWPATSSSDDDATFGGTAGTVTVTTVTANDLTFETTGYSLTGGTLTLDGATSPTITNGAGVDATISSVIAGSAGLTKAGEGTLTLSGANTNAGAVTVGAGTLKAGNAAALGTTDAGTLVADGAVLDVGGQNLGAEVVTISGGGIGGSGAVINSGGSQINALGRLVLGNHATIGGANRWDLRNSSPTLNLAGYTLTKTSSNYVGLIGATVTPGSGNLVVNQGELSLSTTTNLNGSASNSLTVNNGGTLSMYQSSSAHAWTLNLADGATLRAENGTGTQNSWAGPINVNGNITLKADGILNLPAGLTGTANLTKTGTSTAILSGTNSITGSSLTIGAGSLQINTAASLPDTPGVTVTSGFSGALLLGNNLTLGSGKSITIAGGGANGFFGALSAATGNTGTSEWLGNVVIGELTGTRIGSMGGILHVSGNISEANPGSALVVRSDESVNATVLLSGSNSHTGTTTLSASNLRIGSASALGSGPFVVDNAGRPVSLSSADTTAYTIGNPTTLSGTTGVFTLGDATRNGKLTFSSSVDLGAAVRLVGTASEAEFAGVVGGAGGINKSGTGTLVLSGDNTFSGATTIGLGKLKLDYSANGGSKLSDTGSLTFSGGELELYEGSNVELVASTTLTGNTTSTIARTAGTSVIQLNTITRNAGAFLNFSQSDIATTDNTNTNGILGTWATVGATDWAVNSTNGADGSITALSGYTQTLLAGNTGSNYANAHITVDSTQTLGGVITANTLRFNHAGAYTLNLATGNNILNTGGILVTSNVGNNLSSVAGGTLTMPTTGGSLVINQNNTANKLLISSTIANNTGTVAVVKSGAGEAELSAANSYTGSTTVSQGTLTLSGNRTGSSGAITVSNLAGIHATLNIQGGTHACGGNNFIVGNAQGTPATGTVNQTGGVVSFSGSTGNGLLLGNAATTASTGIYNLSGGSINTGNTTANRGVMLGANQGSINVFNLSGTGALNMAAATGGAASSVLQVGRFDSSANSTNNTFNQSGGAANVAILSVGGNGTTGVGIVSNVNWTGGTFVAASFPRLSAGNTNTATITIGGTADVTLPAFPATRGTSSTATLHFDGGTLKPSAASTAYLGGLTNAYVKAGGAKFNTNGFDITVSQALLADPVSTGGGLTKEGAGILTLTGAHTYTGATVISAGTLQIGSAGTTGSLANSSGVTNNGSLIFNRTNTLTQGTDFPNVISGTGGVTKLSTGALVLSGANTYEGNTLFGTAVGTSTGTLRLAHSSALGTGKLIINNGNADTGSVELSGGIQVANNMDFFGRTSGSTGAIIRNVSGDNTLSGVLTGSFNGNSYNIHSDSGMLTISNKITTSSAGRTLTLRGLGSINITGVVENGTGGIGVRLLDAGTYTLAGLNTYTGDTAVNAGSLTLASTGQLRFVPTSNGVSNKVTGPAAGTAVFNANGKFLLDLTGANPTAGNSWLLVDVANVNESYGASFHVDSNLGAFAEASSGVWELTDSGKKWTFTESTGTLSVADAVVDDYAAWSGPSGYNLSGGLAGDDDGDGLTNFQEYAFGLNPTSAASANPISQILNKATGIFKYTRRATPATTGVTYVYESSTTLGGSWSPFTPDSANSNSATPVEEVTVDVPDSLLAEPKLFIRVKASKP